MKNRFYLGLGISCLLMSVASARTWTSASGDKTFEAEFKGYDKTSGNVTVLRESKKLSFPLSKLSEADRQWVEAQKTEVSKAVNVAEQKVGSKLTSKVLSRLKRRRFVRAEMEKTPESYLLYFTASW